jgi:transposase
MVLRNGGARIVADKPVSNRRAGNQLGRKKPLSCCTLLLYTLGLSMNAIGKLLGVSTPSILNWIRAHAATHAPRPQPKPGAAVVVMELDELWHFLKKKRPSSGSGWLLIALADDSLTGNAAIVMPSR